MGGGIYPALSGPKVVNGNEVAGPVTFDLRRHNQYQDDLLKTLDPSMTVIYTVDGKPVSGRLTAPYTFVWDSTTVPDGGHVVSEILVDGARVGMAKEFTGPVTVPVAAGAHALGFRVGGLTIVENIAVSSNTTVLIKRDLGTAMVPQ